MSNVHTGTVNEKRCEDQLKAYGYRTWRTRRQKFGNMDMFGLFDVVAVHNSGERVPSMLFIQVKTNRVDRKTIKAIEDFRLPPWCFKEVWVWQAKEKEWKTIVC